jgi:hypothetical protein
MITIKAIVGETYDLQTCEEVPKQVILTNGISELTVPVNEELMHAAIRLSNEEHVVRNRQPEGVAIDATAPSPAAPLQQAFADAVDPAMLQPAPTFRQPKQAMQEPPSEAANNFMAELTMDAQGYTDDEPGIGEEYSDSDTGTESI